MPGGMLVEAVLGAGHVRLPPGMTDVDLPAVGLALTAALMFAVASNLQRGAASEVPLSHGGPLRLFIHLLTVRRWLFGALLAFVALALHAVALARGGVILVQAILSAGLVAALAVEAARERRWMRPLELLGSLVLVIGVTLVLVWGRPGGGRSVDVTVQVATALLTAVVGGLGLLASRAHHRVRLSAALMGTAAGACFALDAVFLKGVAIFLRGVSWDDPADLLGVVSNVAGFALASALGNIIVQRAYQRAPLRIVLPAVTAADPLAAFAVGRWLLDERLQGGAGATLAVSLGLVAIAVGIVTTTSGAHPIEAPAEHAAGASQGTAPDRREPQSESSP